jgi:hypothetical protein
VSALHFKAKICGIIGDIDKPTLHIHTQSTEMLIEIDWNMALLFAEEIRQRQTAMQTKESAA